MRPAGLEAKALIEGLKPLLVGQDPLERERLHHLMRKWSRTFNLRPLGAVDVALWDLAGKAAGLPIHRLLGTYRTSIPAYASSQELPSVQAYAEQALHFKAPGYRPTRFIRPATRRGREGCREMKLLTTLKSLICSGYRGRLCHGLQQSRLFRITFGAALPIRPFQTASESFFPGGPQPCSGHQFPSAAWASKNENAALEAR